MSNDTQRATWEQTCTSSPITSGLKWGHSAGGRGQEHQLGPLEEEDGGCSVQKPFQRASIACLVFEKHKLFPSWFKENGSSRLQDWFPTCWTSKHAWMTLIPHLAPLLTGKSVRIQMDSGVNLRASQAFQNLQSD